MTSMVRELHKDIPSSEKSITETLRTARVISAKPGLDNVAEWLDGIYHRAESAARIPLFLPAGLLCGYGPGVVQ